MITDAYKLRFALRKLAQSPDGRGEPYLRALSITRHTVNELIEAGFAEVQTVRRLTKAGRDIEAPRVKITEAGLRELQRWSRRGT